MNKFEKLNKEFLRKGYLIQKVEKPGAIKNAESVGVEVFKTRKDYEGS